MAGTSEIRFCRQISSSHHHGLGQTFPVWSRKSPRSAQRQVQDEQEADLLIRSAPACWDAAVGTNTRNEQLEQAWVQMALPEIHQEVVNATEGDIFTIDLAR